MSETTPLDLRATLYGLSDAQGDELLDTIVAYVESHGGEVAARTVGARGNSVTDKELAHYEELAKTLPRIEPDLDADYYVGYHFGDDAPAVREMLRSYPLLVAEIKRLRHG